MTPNSPKINTFKELMDEISYDWDCHYTLTKYSDGFGVNKLYITPKYVTYKTDCHELADGVFEKLEVFYRLLEEE